MAPPRPPPPTHTTRGAARAVWCIGAECNDDSQRSTRSPHLDGRVQSACLRTFADALPPFGQRRRAISNSNGL